MCAGCEKKEARGRVFPFSAVSLFAFLIILVVFHFQPGRHQEAQSPPSPLLCETPRSSLSLSPPPPLPPPSRRPLSPQVLTSLWNAARGGKRGQVVRADQALGHISWPVLFALTPAHYVTMADSAHQQTKVCDSVRLLAHLLPLLPQPPVRLSIALTARGPKSKWKSCTRSSSVLLSSHPIGQTAKECRAGPWPLASEKSPVRKWHDPGQLTTAWHAPNSARQQSLVVKPGQFAFKVSLIFPPYEKAQKKCANGIKKHEVKRRLAKSSRKTA
ncbi:hypothetical protein RRG08_036469 [Elysia crispata]|uniref:Uncharacterized protein n=1 Tax=Elysia crispata TaxID=231223 RepID=A0AAE0ZK20_9GAST|nr:hypothetical protein RRG08_036469 [Elysia crispata]